MANPSLHRIAVAAVAVLTALSAPTFGADDKAPPPVPPAGIHLQQQTTLRIAPTSAIAKAAGVSGGLAVVVGAKDAGALMELAKDGFLVHALVADEATLAAVRDQLVKTGLDGYASAMVWTDAARLPYADRLVSLLVAADGAQLPARQELARVVHPGGAILSNGKAEQMPADPTLGNWRHFDGNTVGSQLSHDQRVKPPTQVQWIAYEQDAQTGHNPAGYSPTYNVRASDGEIVNLIHDPLRQVRSSKGKSIDGARLTARDGFNGVMFWTRPFDMQIGRGIPRTGLVLTDRLAYVYGDDGFINVFDRATGERKTVWKDAFPADTPSRVGGWPGSEKELRQMRVGDQLAVMCRYDEVLGLDPVTGEKRWSWNSGGEKNMICALSLDEASNRVYVAVHDGREFGDTGKKGGPGYKLYDMQTRWPRAIARSVHALDATTGREIWRNDAVAGSEVGQLIPAGDRVIAYGSHSVSGLFAFAVADGKVLWKDMPLREKHFYSMIVRGDSIFLHDSGMIADFSLATGESHPDLQKTSLNSRCIRMSATDDYIFAGLGFTIEKDGSRRFLAIARSGCSQAMIPANGFLYGSANACNCITQLRGSVALTAEPPITPLAEGAALEKGGCKASAVPAAKQELASQVAVDWTSGDWMRQVPTEPEELAPVSAGGIDYVVLPHRHRIEARKRGTAQWAFTADARITGQPLVANGRVFFGASDGWVYCLDAATGAQQWRRLLAPQHRLMVCDGQLQSTWPVFNVVLFDGKICASAGLHSSLDGGIVVAGLDPATGAIAWKQTLQRPAETWKKLPEKALKVPGSATRPPTNQGLAVKDGKLMLGKFPIDPKETAEALLDRLTDSSEQ